MDTTWYHVTYTLDGDSLKTYLNGVLDYSRALTRSFPTASDFALGRMNHSAWDAFKGKFDELAIWERVLNDSEVLNIYNGRITSGTNTNTVDTSFYTTVNHCNKDSFLIGFYKQLEFSGNNCADTLEAQTFNNNGQFITYERSCIDVIRSKCWSIQNHIQRRLHRKCIIQQSAIF